MIRPRLVAALLFVASAGSAAAQSPPDARQIAAAQALYDAAVADLARDDTASACPRLEEVVAIEPAGVGARLTLGSCYERAGRLASAWVTYKLAEAEAARQGQSERKERAAVAVRSLAPRLAHLTIEIPAAVRSLDSLEVLRDGARVGPSQWSEPLPVDSGIHTVQVRAPGHAPWSRTVTVADGETALLRVSDLPPSLPPSGSARPSLSPSPSISGPLAASPLRPAAPFWDTPRVLGATATAFAALSFTGAAVSLAFAVDKKASSDPHCTRDGRCDAAGFPARAEAFAAGNLATAFTVAGALSLTAGLLFGLAWPRPRPRAALSTGTLEIPF